MDTTELVTIRDFIRYAASKFCHAQLYYGHGTDNAWDDAHALILHAIYLPHHIDPTYLDSRLVRDEKNELTLLIQKRIEKRIPVPYLTHEAWFAGLSFYVDERVLIPRSPIAELIENQFTPWIDPSNVHHILDLCTGSGCIAIACAKAFPDAKVMGSDISKEALAVAEINRLRHHVEESVTLYESDLFNTLPKKQYDIIVSNPPYVSTSEMLQLPNEYCHEPKSALAAGEDGLHFIHHILYQACDFLTPEGILVLEVGNSEVALIENYPDIPFIWPEFEKGGGGIFIIEACELERFRDLFLQNMAK